jgi:hypothetical protein
MSKLGKVLFATLLISLSAAAPAISDLVCYACETSTGKCIRIKCG